MNTIYEIFNYLNTILEDLQNKKELAVVNTQWEEAATFRDKADKVKKTIDEIKSLKTKINNIFLDYKEIYAKKLAQDFHETYERLAPDFGYKTREESAKPWANVPEANKNLMVAVCSKILERWDL